MRGNYTRYRAPLLPPLDYERRDGREFGQGYAPSAADALHGEAVQQEIARQGTMPLASVLENLTARNLPPQLVQGTFIKWITAVRTPTLLIPKNPHRFAFIVSNYIGAGSVLFSFDQPVAMQSGVGNTNTLAGIPIGSCYQEANGSVSVNDIWVFCNDTAGDYPIPILGYEANLSITGNRP